MAAGDTYGFTFGGFNFDSDPTFNGTLALAPPNAPYIDPAAVANNTSWTTAAPLTTAGIDGTLTQPGEVRWYKFPVQPDSQVQVDLEPPRPELRPHDVPRHRSGVHHAGLDARTSPSSARSSPATRTARRSTRHRSTHHRSTARPIYSPIHLPPIDLLAIDLQPIDLQPIHLLTIHLQPIDLLTIHLQPVIYSPSIYSPSDAFLAAFSGAQTRSLIGVSAHDNADPESIRTATWNNTGDFYVRVQGRNGAVLTDTVPPRLTTAGGPCASLTLDSFNAPRHDRRFSRRGDHGHPHRQLANRAEGSGAASPRRSTRLEGATGGVGRRRRARARASTP